MILSLNNGKEFADFNYVGIIKLDLYDSCINSENPPVQKNTSI